jgi:hypothetical protein
MQKFRIVLASMMLSLPLFSFGCGDSSTNSDAPAAEELTPDFGPKAAEKMKNMIGTPSAKGPVKSKS